MQALKKAKQSIPDSRWWIKAYACDVRKGLRESMQGIWANILLIYDINTFYF